MDEPEYLASHKPAECPVCRSGDIIKVITGMEMYDSEEDEELCRIGKAVKYPSYCCSIDEMPKWRCVSCKQYIYKASTRKTYIFDTKPRQCPVCNSPRIMDIIYGEPSSSNEFRRKIRNGEVIIGGCDIEEACPAWLCRDCLQDLHTNRRYPC